MNNWNLFLNKLHANALALEPAINSDPIPTYLVDLRHQGLLGIEGPDAAKFLQGQVTCDVRDLAEKVTRLGAQCTLKGRMLLSFRALQLQNNHIMLRMHGGLVEKAIASFGKYIVFSKAKLHDRSDHYRRLGIYGPAAEKLLEQALGAVPTERDAWTQCENAVVIKLDEHRYECWLAPEQAERIWLALMPGCALAGENFWTLLDIRAGIGEVRPETSELLTPQAINYQLVNGINFRKGCYTGQEIVARLHYRGTLKRHMYRFITANDKTIELPLPGTAVVNAAQQNIGEIVLSARTDSESIEVLATLVDEQISQAYLALEPLQKLEQLPLPYAIPSEDNS